MTKRLTVRQVALLKNAPGKNASTEHALTKSIDALSTALEAIGGQLPPGKNASTEQASIDALSTALEAISEELQPGKNASTERALRNSFDALSTAFEAIGKQLQPGCAAALQKILRTALNLSRMKGIYEGLGEGFRLHEISLEIEENPAERSLLRRIYRYPPQSEDREVTNEGLCKYLDGEIERLSGTDGQPFPPHKWGVDARQVNPWQFALRDEKLGPRVMTHLKRMRDQAWGQTYGFLRAWEELSPKTERNGFLRTWEKLPSPVKRSTG